MSGILKFKVGDRVLIYGIETVCAGFMSHINHFGKKEYEYSAVVQGFSPATRRYIIQLESGRVLTGILEEEMKLQ